MRVRAAGGVGGAGAGVHMLAALQAAEAWTTPALVVGRAGLWV